MAGDASGTSRRDQVLAVGLGAVLLAAVAVGSVLAHHAGRPWMDLEVYRAGGQAVLTGQPLYEVVTDLGLAYTYPPLTSVLFVPFALLSADAAIAVWTVASVLCLVLLCWVVLTVLDLAAPGRRTLWAVLAAVAVLPLYPVANHLVLGQVSVLVVTLVVVSTVGARREVATGIGVGVAAAVKLTPLIFVGYLLLTGRPRAAGIAVGVFAAAGVAGFLLFPHDSATYWGGLFLDSSRVTDDPARVINQSLHGLLLRLTGADAEALWLLVAALVGVAGLVTAAAVSRRGQELGGVLCCAVTGLLVSPVSWDHHWIWVVPGLLFLAARVRSGPGWFGVALVWLAVATTIRWEDHPRGDDPFLRTGVGVVFGNLYVLAGLAALTCAACWASRRPPLSPGTRAAVTACRRPPTGRR